MDIEKINKICTGCGACLSVCPEECISLEWDEEGFYFPKIAQDKCINCGKCNRVCHVLNPMDINITKKSFYGFSKDESIRNASTSGGAFAALAKNVIEKGGNVYGAHFDYESLLLKHADSDTVGLEALQKSKYIESYMGDTIRSVQRDLDYGRPVLFCGTPCQVSGLKHAIKDKNNLLLTIDFICHGIPSSMLFKEHLNKLTNRKIKQIDFRPKEFGWSGKNLKVETERSVRVIPYRMDSFYYGFMAANVILRKSCYDCKFRAKHYADITIADFWGYKAVNKKINDEKGISLLIANNEKGNKSVEELKNFELTPLENSFSEYAFAKKDYSASVPVREKFYKLYKKYGFEKASKKTYMKNNQIKWLKYYFKKIIGL